MRYTRLILLPLGIFKALWTIFLDSSRDLDNKIRFRQAIIDDGCKINNKTTIFPKCHILSNCIINSSEINSYTYVGRNSLIQNTRIGKFCSIASDVIIGLGSHPSKLMSTSPIFYRVNNPLKMRLIKDDLNYIEYRKIDIGNDVWIGARAIILDGVKVGDGAIIAANAVVTKDIPPYSIAAGVPAKIIKHRFNEETIENLSVLKWWDWDITKIRDNFLVFE